MINLLTQFPELEKYDLTSLERMAYGGSPMAPELIRRTRAVLPHVRLVQGYGLSETGFLTALLDNEHTPDKLMSCGRPCPGIDVRVVDRSGTEVSAGQPGELVARGAWKSGFRSGRDRRHSPRRPAVARRGCLFADGRGQWRTRIRSGDGTASDGRSFYRDDMHGAAGPAPPDVGADARPARRRAGRRCGLFVPRRRRRLGRGEPPERPVVRVPGQSRFNASRGAEHRRPCTSDADWIAFVDSDVVLDPGFAATVIRRLVTPGGFYRCRSDDPGPGRDVRLRQGRLRAGRRLRRGLSLLGRRGQRPL